MEVRDRSCSRSLIYDIHDTTRALIFPYDPKGMFELSMDPSLAPCHMTIDDNDPSSPSKLDHLKKHLIDPHTSLQLLHSHHELQATMKHDAINKDHNEYNMPKVAIHRRFMTLIIDISILWLKEKCTIHSSLPPSSIIFSACSFHLPTSHPHDSTYDCSFLYYHIGDCRGECIYNALMTCWLHWIYDYT